MKILVEYPAFDGGARTVKELRGDGTFSFGVGRAVGVVCGLGEIDRSAAPFDVLYGFKVEGESCYLIESGRPDIGPIPYAASDRFALDRINGTIRYYIADALVGTAVKPSTALLFGDCSLFAFGDEILDAEMTDTVIHEQNGGEIGIGRIGGTGSDTAAPHGFAGLGPLTVKCRALEPLSLGALWATGSDTAAPHGFAGLGPLSAFGADSMPVAEYGAGRAYLGPVSASGHEVMPGATGDLAGVGWIGVRGTDTAGASYGFVSLGVIAIAAAIHHPNRLIASGPAWSMRFSDPSERALAAAPVPVPLSSGQTGDAVTLPVPVPSLVASASGEHALADLLAIVPALFARAIDGTGATVALLSVPVLRASGSSADTRAALRAIIPDLVATARDEDTGWAIALPAIVPALFARASDDRTVATLQVIVPALDAGYATVALLPVALPALSARATDRPDAAAADRLAAIAVNLAHHGVTLPVYPAFSRLARVGERVYGIAANGELVELAAMPVHAPARFTLPPSDFGSPLRKRASYLYLHGRANSPVAARVEYDEVREIRYVSGYAPGEKVGVQRVKLGKGMDFWRAAVTVENKASGSLNVGAIELIVQPLSKRTA